MTATAPASPVPAPGTTLRSELQPLADDGPPEQASAAAVLAQRRLVHDVRATSAARA